MTCLRPCLNFVLMVCATFSHFKHLCPSDMNEWLLNDITFWMLKNSKVYNKLVFSRGISNNHSKSLKQISTVLLHGTSVLNSSWETLMRDFKQFQCQLQRRHGFKVPVICPYWALVIRTWCQVAVIHSRWISRGALLMGQLMYSVNCDCHARQGLSYLQLYVNMQCVQWQLRCLRSSRRMCLTPLIKPAVHVCYPLKTNPFGQLL